MDFHTYPEPKMQPLHIHPLMYMFVRPLRLLQQVLTLQLA